MSNKSKHSQLAKATIGQYHKNEWAILGDHCDAIHEFAQLVAKALAPKKVVYVDADHNPQQSSSPLFYLQDQQNHWQNSFSKAGEWNIKTTLLDADLVLVNGNHFSASRQVVLINEEKEKSLQKRINEDSQVDAIFFKKDQEIPPFIQNIFPNNNFIYLEKNKENITRFFEAKTPMPDLKVLIMVGGKSTRMGTDKSQIKYYEKSQDLFIAELCSKLSLPFAFSCSSENVARYLEQGYEAIVDSFLNLGPKGGILSAFQSQPNVAWLVVACDLPMIDEHFFQELITHRDSTKLATTFISPENQMPEPLAAIWEPRAYVRALQFLALGNSCPRKILMQSEIYAIQASNPLWLKNANTPEDVAFVKTRLS